MAWCGPHMTVAMVRGEDGHCDTVYFSKDRFVLGPLHMSFVHTPRPVLQCRQPVHTVQVNFGESHMAVVTGCKQLFMAGSQGYGQLCCGTPSADDSHYALFRAQVDRAVQSAVCGSCHTLVVLESSGESKVWGCGKNYSGQLSPLNNCYTTRTEIDLTPLKAEQLTPGAVRVAAGSRHSVFAVGDAVGTMGKVANASRTSNPLSSASPGSWKIHTDVP